MHSQKGPYEKADYEFRNNRDNNLWIACLASSNQDASIAKSKYIKHVAQLYAEEEIKHIKIREEKERKATIAREKADLESKQRQKQIEQEIQTEIEKEILTRDELPFLRPKIGALFFFIFRASFIHYKLRPRQYCKIITCFLIGIRTCVCRICTLAKAPWLFYPII